jgi:SAM-dependent methyltransferase
MEWACGGQRHWKRLSEFSPTPPKVVVQALTLAEVGPEDVVYDLGCGNGGVIAKAAKFFGARAVGFDIDRARIRASRARIEWLGLSHLASVRRQDLLSVRTLHKATIIYTYLPQHALNRLKPVLLMRCRKGTRVISVSHWGPTWLYGWKPTKELTIRLNGTKWFIGVWTV